MTDDHYRLRVVFWLRVIGCTLVAWSLLSITGIAFWVTTIAREAG